MFSLLLSVIFSLSPSATACPVTDEDSLGMALEYFTSNKYHEALLLFEQLNRRHQLNPRFHAYKGICHYYEWEYKEAAETLERVMPQLEGFAPHERSLYYYVAGESRFQLAHYREAIGHYERVLTVCYDKEKGDILYKLGLCYLFLEEWQSAHDFLLSARCYYTKFRNTDNLKARLIQIDNMMRGLANNKE